MNNIILLMRIQFYIFVNRFIDAIYRLPFVKPGRYGLRTIKELYFIAIFFNIVRKIILNIFKPIIIVLLLTLVSSKGTLKLSDNFSRVSLILFTIIILSSVFIKKYDEEVDETMISVLKVNTKSYYISTMYYSLAFRMFFSTIVIFSMYFREITIIQVLNIPVLIYFNETFRVYSTVNKLFKKSYKTVVEITIISIAAAIFLIYKYDINNKNIIGIYSFIIFLGISIYITRGLFKLEEKTYTDSYYGIREDREKLFQKNSLGKMEMKEVELKDRDTNLDVVAKNKLKKFKGMRYLNELFFERNRSILTKPLFIRMAVLSGLFLLGIVVVKFRYIKIVNIYNYSLAPLSLLTLLSIGEKTVKSLFYNCDISFLRNPWYRTRKNLLESYFIRLKYILRQNIILGGIIALLILVFNLIERNLKTKEYTLMLVSIILFSILLSVVQISLYYLMQPYGVEKEKMSFSQSLVLGIKYTIIYTLYRNKVSIIEFSKGYFNKTIILAIVLIILVSVFSVKRFRIKEE